MLGLVENLFLILCRDKEQSEFLKGGHRFLFIEYLVPGNGR